METKFNVVAKDSKVSILPSSDGEGLIDAIADAGIVAHQAGTNVEVLGLTLSPKDVFELLDDVLRAVIAEEWPEEAELSDEHILLDAVIVEED